MKKYKVHVGYISSNGVVIRPGIYSDEDIDVAEANSRSYITPENIEDNKVEHKNELPIIKDVEVKVKSEFTGDDIKSINLEAVETTIVPKRLPINTTNVSKLIALKAVGKKTADKVITERAKAEFTSYNDLNSRVPLANNRKWEDITPIDFEQIAKPAMDFTISDTASK